MRTKRALVALLLAVPAALGCAFVTIGLIAVLDRDGSGVRGLVVGVLLVALPVLVAKWIRARNSPGV